MRNSPVGENVCAQTVTTEINRIEIVQAMLRANESAKLPLCRCEAIQVPPRLMVKISVREGGKFFSAAATVSSDGSRKKTTDFSERQMHRAIYFRSGAPTRSEMYAIDSR